MKGVQLPHCRYTWYFDKIEHLLNEDCGDGEEQNDTQRQELRKTLQPINCMIKWKKDRKGKE